jgi:autotransporter-associated beta strand protein
MKPKNTLRRFLALAGSLLAVSYSHAADGTWNGISGNWTDTTNPGGVWSGGTIADGIDSTAFFTGVDIAADRSIALNGNRTIGNITFTDDTTPSNNLAITGNTLTLDRTSGAPVVNVTQAGRTLSISSIIAGNDGLQKTGDGTLTLSGANSYTGTTTVDSGILALATPVATGANSFKGPLVVNANGTVRWDIEDGVADASTVTVNGGTLNLGSKSDYINTLSLNSGAQVQGDQSSTQYIIVNGSAGAKILGTGGGNAGTISSKLAIASQWGVVTGARTQEFDVASATTLTVSGPIVNSPAGSGDRVGSLLKSNSGTLTLSGTNTYTGTTTVSQGTLLVNGTHITSTSGSGYTVSGGSTLGGTGRLAVNGSVSVASTAILSPGASIGTLALDGANTTGNVLNMTTGSKFSFELDGSGGTPDQLAFWNYLSGDLTLNANTIDLSLLGTQAAGTHSVDIFRFFSNAGTTATTHAFSSGLNIGTLGTGISSASIDWDGTGNNNQTIALTYTVIPEPRAALLGGIGLLMLLRRRRA